MRATRATPPGAAGRSTRRAFQYLLLFVLLVVAGIGVAGLLGAALAQGTDVTVSDADLARSISFTVIGLPLLGAVAIWTRRTLGESPDEQRSIAWLVCLTAGAFISLVIAVIALHQLLGFAVGLQDFDPDATANAVVWSGVWVGLWRVLRRHPDPALTEPALLLGTLFALVIGVIGFIILVSGALAIWCGLVPEAIVLSDSDRALSAALTVLLAAPVWVLHWVRGAARLPDSPLHLTFLLLVGVAGSLVVTVSAGSVAAYRVAVWTVGSPWTDQAERYFAGLPTAVATAVAGLLSLAYHRAVLDRRTTTTRTEVDRVRDYLLATVGLGAAATGTTIIVVALVEAATRPAVLVGDAPLNTLLAALILLVAGTPVWLHHWRRSQRAVAADPAELLSRVRRIDLFALIGVATLIAVGALIAAVWILLDEVLQGTGPAASIRAIRYPVGLLVTSGLVAGYHWSVHLHERRPREEAAPSGPRFVLLLGVGDDTTRAEVARRTGAQVWAWQRTDQPSAGSTDAVVEALAASHATDVVVTSEVDGIRVVPVERH